MSFYEHLGAKRDRQHDTNSSIVRPRITPNPIDANPLRMSSTADAT
jgi:hypothetical protein